MNYKNEFEEMLDRACMKIGDITLIIVALAVAVMIIRIIATIC